MPCHHALAEALRAHIVRRAAAPGDGMGEKTMETIVAVASTTYKVRKDWERPDQVSVDPAFTRAPSVSRASWTPVTALLSVSPE